MFANGWETHGNAPTQLTAEAADLADARMVNCMRLVLAMSALLASISNLRTFPNSGEWAWLLFAAYVAHSATLCVFALLQRPVAQSKWMHWLDVAWYTAFVALTGDSRSLLFLFFFFAILVSSLRWGFEEGARVTAAATALFVGTVSVADPHPDWPVILLRSSFLLALGYISAYWGESKVALNRRLDLLRDVSQLSNPRFGVDHTMTRVLDTTRAFFNAKSCVLILRDKETGSCHIRSIQASRPKQSVHAETISAQTAEPLLTLPPEQLVLYSRPRWPIGNRWNIPASDIGERLTDLLEGHAFISAPVSLRRSEGRIYVVTDKKGNNKANALFLSHIVAQAFPVIENIELVDRMASEAASQERQKIALDIHDRAVQPYIGLSLGLSALRNHAEPGNPLLDDIDKLNTMARQTIDDLRHYAGTFRQNQGQRSTPEPIYAAALQQQTDQVKALYGVDIAVDAAANLQINDRMAAEVLQIVREGLSNICRHTLAQFGALRLQRSAGWLHIQIENDGDSAPVPAFSPRSITERVASLGGRVRVQSDADGYTTVQIQIPV
ncbi:MAG: histidine kinase [Polaromonas sp.]|nr:histidine kinase [Polaromonas sp.]